MDPGGILQEQAYPTPYANSSLLPLLLLSLATQKHSPNYKTSTSQLRNEYDYIVVGAGSAGAAVAARLSEKGCVSVLLLEAGKPPPRLTEIPAIPRCYVNSDIDWKFLTTPQKHSGAGLVDKRLTWPSGKTLGGSSILNAMLNVRGNRRNYDEWAKMGAEGWSYNDVLPYFKKLEDNTDPEYLANGFHGAGGPITASRPNYSPLKKEALMEAVRNEGFKFVDSNAFEQIGFFDYQGSIRNGQRSSTAKGYLVPAENRPNLDILPNAFVRKVVIKNKRATGVEFDFDNSTRTVKAKREVIMSAGTTNTAQLLMLSGVGPASELNKFGIPVLADLPVGQNMQDHPATVIAYEVDDTVPRFDDEVRKNESIQNYITRREGPLTAAEGFILMSFLRNSDNNQENIPDHSVYFADFLDIQLLQGGYTKEFVNALLAPFANKSLITVCSQLLHPKSRGTVTLLSTNPYDPPAIDPNYYEKQEDVHDMIEGLKTAMRIMNNPAMLNIGAKPLNATVPGCEQFAEDLDKYLDCTVRAIVFTTSHQVGTAKMGRPNDPTTVVDPKLRVKGIRGLRVVDASIMPTIPWSNTNIPTIMVAEKAADIIKETIKCRTIPPTIPTLPPTIPTIPPTIPTIPPML